MSEPDNFLARWSRRKRDVAEAEQAPDPSARPREGGDPEPRDAESVALDSRLRGNERTSESDRDTTASKEPPFDLASLPSIESIAADTDIRGFLAPGVPAELTRAALRRAWAADPKIRDFVGLEENAWDFNNPESIPGFGKLEMTDELRREVARIVGNFMEEPEPAAPGAGAPPQALEATDDLASDPEPVAIRQASSGQSTEPSGEQTPEPKQQPTSDVAVQKEERPAESLQVAARRSHGGALPK
jgi:hypothetical protein